MPLEAGDRPLPCVLCGSEGSPRSPPAGGLGSGLAGFYFSSVTQGSSKLNNELKTRVFVFLFSVEDASTFPDALERIGGPPNTSVPPLFYAVPGGWVGEGRWAWSRGVLGARTRLPVGPIPGHCSRFVDRRRKRREREAVL